MNILLVTNEAYLLYTKLLLISLFRQHPDTTVDVYLFHRDLSDDSLQQLTLLTTEYPNKRLFPTQLTAEHTVGLKSSDKLPIETYFRILALDLLPENIDRILYLDVDMIVKKPLTELYRMDFQGHAAIVCQDIYGYVYGASEDSEARLHLSSHGQYFNAGFILFNLIWFREHDYAKKILDYIYDHECQLLWQDQDALNATLDGKVILVPWHLYNCPPISMICRRDDIAAGRIRPLWRKEISIVNEQPDLFWDMTQAIYEEAHIIHYIGETKPNKPNRPPASCFRIFDQAFATTQKLLPVQHKEGTFPMNILLVTNEAYLLYTKLLLISLFRQHPDTAVDVYLFHRDLSDDSLQQLTLLTSEYPNKQFFHTQLTAEHTAGLKPTDRLPIEVYFRILALDLLPESIDRILYLDVDIIIKKPLTELYQLDFEGQAAIVCQDITMYLRDDGRSDEQRLQLKLHGQYFNSGVILFNLTWFRAHNYTKPILDYIYSHDCQLLWQDQDALNVMLEGKVLFVPWYLYNCPPYPLIGRKEEITAACINPLHVAELPAVNKCPEQYVDITQFVYDVAYVIHYIAKSKPDLEGRASAPCYDIFDQAFLSTRQILSQQTHAGRLIFLIGADDTLDLFSDDLIREFRRMNYEILVFDTRNIPHSLARLSEFIKQPVTAAITFNDLGFNMEVVEGKNIWDELGIFCVNILTDHPSSHKAALEKAPANAIVLCTDKDHMDYVQQSYPNIPITGFLSTAEHTWKHCAHELHEDLFLSL